MAADGSESVDLAEPRALARELAARGCCLVNVTAGVPRLAPHVGRPFDRPAAGGAVPSEHPLVGEGRLIALAAAIQQACAPVPVVGTGYSWLRQFWPYVGAAVLRRKMAAFIGLGRTAFAYPDAARDLMVHGALDPKKCCCTCSRCVDRMRRQVHTGCAVHDRALYGST
jgi:2,4-dienoyl-CoA reductase-like NADH-dependent reductase (Old Yellow Enzyme family)